MKSLGAAPVLRGGTWGGVHSRWMELSPLASLLVQGDVFAHTRACTCAPAPFVVRSRAGRSTSEAHSASQNEVEDAAVAAFTTSLLEVLNETCVLLFVGFAWEV